MKDWQAQRIRYQRDTPSVQIGGLASNLGRIAWFAQRQGRDEALPIFRESKYFTEWAAPACTLDQQAILADVQLRLALWERGWGSRFTTVSIAQEAQQWSAKLLESSGLGGGNSPCP